SGTGQPPPATAGPGYAHRPAARGSTAAGTESPEQFLWLRWQQLQSGVGRAGMKIFIDAVGLAAPGLSSWAEALPVLRGEQAYEAQALDRYMPAQLPANERRRAADFVRMAFRVGEDVLRDNPVSIRRCAAVLASSGGDEPITDQICKALCEPERLLSPTQFHNSVHNSAAGYWSIATGSRAPSTSISAFDDTFAAGLLEAASLCAIEQLPTILAVYDIKPPEPLQSKRPITLDFGVAFLLSPVESTRSLAQLTLTPAALAAGTPAQVEALEAMRLSNPAARSLPLLELIARRQAGQLLLDANNNPTTIVEVTPCP